MIEFDRVSFSYGDKPVLHAFSYRFEAGRRYAVLGPSGAGKTTLVHLAAGLLLPTSGRVTSDERASVCFQEDRLLPWYTARQNVALALSTSLRDEAALAMADGFLSRVELTGDEADAPVALSGGMKRRVALARALAQPSTAVLLDEPFRALDASTRERMLSLVLEKTEGKLLLLVTHEEEDAQGMEIVRL